MGAVTVPSPIRAASLVEQIRAIGFTHIVSVPDYVQIALHKLLDDPASSGPAVVYTTTENEAVEVAAGLYVGGKSPLVIVQNQGVYNSLNAIRALGIDARLPIPMLVGQFGREFDNVGSDPAESDRPLVRNMERLLDALDIPHARIEGDADAAQLAKVAAMSRDQECIAAALVGGHIAWD